MKYKLRFTRKTLTILLISMILVNLGILAWVGTTIYAEFPTKENNTVIIPQKPETSSTPFLATNSPSPLPTLTTGVAPTQQPINRVPELTTPDILILSMSDGLRIHLFAYHPQYLPLTRLTNTPYDDIHPAVSPDGKKVAFSSRRNGFWDIYILDLESQKITQITDTPAYDGSPGWSPDGQWLVYESYQDNNLDIFLLSLTDRTQAPVRLTDSPAAEFSPSWSPGGREIAYTSNINGEDRIYIAYLDRSTDRVVQVNPYSLGKESNPRWSPDGKKLCWTQEQPGGSQIFIWDKSIPDMPPRPVTYANRAAWMSDSNSLFIQVTEPNRTTFGAVVVDPSYLAIPLNPLPGALHGFDVIQQAERKILEPYITQESQKRANPIWQPNLSVYPMVPTGRFAIVPLKDISAPFPMLLDTVDEAFNKLREKVSIETGWDALSSLENAFIPLTISPSPTIETDWHYTGRAWSLNPLFMSAGWMVICRENFAGQTYWRVYLKARFQDGSMGLPLRTTTWDLNSRFSGDPRAYEDGGTPGSIPSGYWIDLTEIASRYGWERLPSLVNWRTYFPAIRYNQFVMKGSLDWITAMSELYPPEALTLPTRTPLPTPYPTRTPTNSNFSQPGPTRTPTITMTPTLNPTWTPLPGTP